MDASSSIAVVMNIFCVQVKMIGRNRKLVHGSFSMDGVWTLRERGECKTFWERSRLYRLCAFMKVKFRNLKLGLKWVSVQEFFKPSFCLMHRPRDKVSHTTHFCKKQGWFVSQLSVDLERAPPNYAPKKRNFQWHRGWGCINLNPTRKKNSEYSSVAYTALEPSWMTDGGGAGEFWRQRKEKLSEKKATPGR